jgi:hypothetical protein
MVSVMKRRRIFYHCYDSIRPSGGQKSTYHHVDALNRNGFCAYVVHTSRASKLAWFANDTAVMTWRELWATFDDATDILVFPEDLGARIVEYPGTKVIFNKNVYYGFRALDTYRHMPDFFKDANVIGIMVVSHHNQRQAKYVYPEVPVFLVTEWVDSSRFEFVPLKQKLRQGAYVPKATSLLRSVLHAIRARSEQAGTPQVEWFPIEGLTESEVAGLLRDSVLCLFPSTEEGLGRTPLEGLLCGCVVLGFSAGPLAEYLPQSLRCEYGDVAGIASKIEDVLGSDADSERLQADILEGRNNALKYSREALDRSVCSAWQELFRLC